MSDDEKLLQLKTFLSQCPKGSEPLVVRCISIVASKHNFDSEFVTIAQNLYNDRIKDIRIITPLIHKFSPNDLKKYFLQIIALSQPIIKETFSKYLHYNDSLKPKDLLHIIVDTCVKHPESSKDVIKAFDCCIGIRDMYNEIIVIELLNDLILTKSMPRIFMRLVLSCYTTFPNSIVRLLRLLKNFINQENTIYSMYSPPHFFLDNPSLMLGNSLYIPIIYEATLSS